MTPTTTDLGPSWLRSLPNGASVLRRDVHECVVVAVDSEFFSARFPGERRRRYFDPLLIADEDRPLLKPGARFWSVTERVCLRGSGRAEYVSAIRFQRPGHATAESLFLAHPCDTQETP